MAFIERPGARIWWEAQGAGTPVLIVQGIGQSADASWRILPALLAAHTVLLTDNRGSGRSLMTNLLTNPACTVTEMAEDVAAVIQTAGLGPVHLVGLSMGGLIAQELALTRPELVATLVLACTSPGGPDAVPMSAAALAPAGSAAGGPGRARPGGGRLEAAVAAARISYAPRTPTPAVRADARVLLARPFSHTGYAAQLQAIAGYPGSLPRLGALGMPVLILHGSADLVVPPANAALLAAAIPHARCEILSGAGHVLTTDATAALSRAILDFTMGVDVGVDAGVGVGGGSTGKAMVGGAGPGRRARR